MRIDASEDDRNSAALRELRLIGRRVFASCCVVLYRQRRDRRRRDHTRDVARANDCPRAETVGLAAGCRRAVDCIAGTRRPGASLLLPLMY